MYDCTPTHMYFAYGRYKTGSLTGKTGELRNGCFIPPVVEKLGVLTLAIKLSMDAAHLITLCADLKCVPGV